MFPGPLPGSVFRMCMRFPVCAGRQPREQRRAKTAEKKGAKVRTGGRREPTSAQFFFLLGKDEGSAEESGAHRPAAGSHGRPADFCGHTQPAVGELWTRRGALSGLGGFGGRIVELQPQRGGILFFPPQRAQRARSRRRRASLGSHHDVPNLIHSLSKSRKT